MGREGLTLPDAATVYRSDIGIEKVVIGCLLNDPASASIRLHSLCSDDFAFSDSVTLYEAILKAWTEKGATDIATVGSYLLGHSALLRYLTECSTSVGVGVKFEQSVQRLKEISAERKAHTLLMAGLNAIHNGNADIGQLVADLQLTQSQTISHRAYKADAFFADAMQEEEALLMCRGKGIVYQGDITTLQGQAKTCKTTLLMTILATLSTGEPNLMFETLSPRKVLLIDTEQSAYNLNKQGQKARQLGADLKNVRAYAMRSVPTAKQILDYTIQAANEWRPDIIIVDNIKDMVADFNNLTESSETVRRLMKLAEDLKCGIIAVIHENIDSEKARGHIGSALVEKVSTVIRTERTQEDNRCFRVRFPTTRNAPVEEFCFRLDEDVLPELVDYQPIGNFDELNSIFIRAFENAQDGCRHTELKEIIMEITGKKMSTAKTLIKQAQQAHIIFKSCDKYYLSRYGSNLGQI